MRVSSDSTNYEHIKKIIELADKTGVSEGRLKELVGVLGVTGDRAILADIERALTFSGRKKLADPFHTNRNFEGQFSVGETKDGTPVRLSEESLNRNLLTVGQTGAGKTVFFYNLIHQLDKKKLPFWIFDFKTDYRHLIQNLDDLLVIRWEDLKFNPLRVPPGVSPSRWAQVFANTFSDSQGFLTASKYFLYSRIYGLYKLYGVLEGKEKYPSFHELAQVLKYEKQPLVTKQARYLETTINRVQAISLALGQVLDCESGYPLDNLLNQKVVLECEGLAEEISNFLVEILLVWIYFYRMAQGHRGRLRHCILFDEARRVFNRDKEKRYESGVPIIDFISAKTREFGESFIIADQELTKLTDSIKANCYSILGLPLGSGKDIDELARVMGLSKRQKDRLYELDIGQGVFKKSGSRPIRLSIPLVEVDKGITTQEVKERMREPLAWLNKQVKERFRPPDFDQYLQKLAGAHKIKSKAIEGEPSSENLKQDSLSSVGKRLLVHIAEKPFTQLSDRYQELGISTYKGNRARKVLLGRGLLEEREINLGAGGRPKYFELTEEGEKLYRELKPDEDYVIKGGGGFKHRFWQHKISQYYNQKYYQTFIEYGLGDSQLDVFAVSNQKRVGIEVAMSSKGEVENIKKNLKLDLDELIVACKDPEVISQVGKKAREKLGEKKVSEVRFCTVTDFLES